MRLVTIFLVLTLTGLGACMRQQASDTTSTARKPVATATTETDPAIVTGTVVETMDASGYTYMRIDSGSGEFWAATSQFKVAAGDRVVVAQEMPMKDFHSRTLNRDFPLIYFVTRIAREGEPLPPAMTAEDTSTGGQPAEAQVPAEKDIVVTPAEGGTTVAGVWKNRTALAGKTVTVRGRVVKFSSGILDRNWMHIQDGTGTPGDGSNDLTVTTTGTARIGDVITAIGKIAADKDFGAGYMYPVILEDATVTAK